MDSMDRIIEEYNLGRLQTPPTSPPQKFSAIEVFKQNNGDTTKAYYEALSKRIPLGPLAVALFRAQKRSTRAKQYRRGKWRHAAYDVKNWSIGEVCRLLKETNLVWGWQRDPKTPGYEWVLYVDLPFGCGQCSFHNASRGDGPDYPFVWDEKRESAERIIRFCDKVFSGGPS